MRKPASCDMIWHTYVVGRLNSSYDQGFGGKRRFSDEASGFGPAMVLVKRDVQQGGWQHQASVQCVVSYRRQLSARVTIGTSIPSTGGASDPQDIKLESVAAWLWAAPAGQRSIHHNDDTEIRVVQKSKIKSSCVSARRSATTTVDLPPLIVSLGARGTGSTESEANQ